MTLASSDKPQYNQPIKHTQWISGIHLGDVVFDLSKISSYQDDDYIHGKCDSLEGTKGLSMI